MRSILLEASSIERAIDKAWNEAGKPREFTIKVHDEGERNFLGFSRRPARLSILFVPQRDESASRSSRGRSRNNNENRRSGDRNDRNDRNDRRYNSRSSDRNDRNDRNDRSSGSSDRRPSRSDSPTRYPADSTKNTGASSNVSASSASQDWRGEWEKYVITTVRDIVKLMDITIPFEAQRDDKMLTLTFKKRVLEDAEEQHMLFASLSYLSIQFLKRHYKNRFLGYRVLITCAEGEKPVRKSEPAAEPSENASSSSAPTERRRRTPRRTNDAESTVKPRSRNAAPKGVSDDIVSEQILFAQQQLERERAEEESQKKTAPVETAPAKATPIEAAPAEVTPVEKPVKKAAAKKEAPKPRRFYVMPDEEGDGGNK